VSPALSYPAFSKLWKRAPDWLCPRIHPSVSNNKIQRLQLQTRVDKNGSITVHRMVCAIDCGTAVFPDAIRAQAEAGVVMGLSVAFHEKIRFADGGVKTSNYSDYRVLSMSEVPKIEVHIAQNNLKAGGIGEPVFPSVAPAVANAVFRATGVRLRELPFQTDLLAS
jgi:isoquinoline 1-oxidoreductase subunit beta